MTWDCKGETGLLDYIFLGGKMKTSHEHAVFANNQRSTAAMHEEYHRLKKFRNSDELKKRSKENLQREYDSLKALTHLLGKEDLKLEDMDSIMFKRHMQEHETEIISYEYDINVIVKDADLKDFYGITCAGFSPLILKISSSIRLENRT